MKILAKGMAFILALFLCAACSSAPKNSAGNNSFTLSEKKLLNIIDGQERFIQDSKRKNKLDEAGAKTRLAAMENLWRDYFAANPEDANALIIYGKFLRIVRDTEKSYEIFKKADALSPDTAVVKQQLSSYETEMGDYASALNNIRRACVLEPNVALYHFQLGELIHAAGGEMAEKKIIAQEQADGIMLNAFAQAAKLEPKNKNYAIRHAQAFFNIEDANWQDALNAVDKALAFQSLILERDDMLAKKAHALSELGRESEAKEALNQIKRREDLIKSKNRPSGN